MPANLTDVAALAAPARGDPLNAGPSVLTLTALSALQDGLSTVNPDKAISWFHLRRNAYIDSSTWDALSAEQRPVVRAQVVAAASPGDRLLSHCAAAAVLGIPLIGRWPELVDILVPHDTHGGSSGIQRRRTQNLPTGITAHGLTVTSPARTAVDLARIGSLATGVTALDHVLHHHRADRTQLISEVDAIPKNGRGKRRARLALALARHDSESPAESLSRARLFELRIAQPALQVEFTDSGGFIGRVDMYWQANDLVGEVDGRLKYRVGPGDCPEAAAAVVWREKIGEDRLRAVVSKCCGGHGTTRSTSNGSGSNSRQRVCMPSRTRHGWNPSSPLTSSKGVDAVERGRYISTHWRFVYPSMGTGRARAAISVTAEGPMLVGSAPNTPGSRPTMRDATKASATAEGACRTSSAPCRTTAIRAAMARACASAPL